MSMLNPKCLMKHWIEMIEENQLVYKSCDINGTFLECTKREQWPKQEKS